MPINDSINPKEQIEELYGWYSKRAKGYLKDDYQRGKCDGAIEALGAVYLGLYGGRETVMLMEKNLNDNGTSN